MKKIQHLLFSPHGRINRKDFWLGQFLVILIGVVLAMVFHITIPHKLSWSVFSLHNLSIGAVIGVVFFYCHAALNKKRLHDLGKGTGFVLICYVPVIGALYTLFYLGMIEGQSREDNDYGAATK